MRIWQDATGALITDEALVRYVAAYGSLEAAAAAGNVRLAARGDEGVRERTGPASCERSFVCADAGGSGGEAPVERRSERANARRPRRSLKDYLTP